jgi:hypothetical protein
LESAYEFVANLLERLQQIIDDGIVAAFLDQRAGMSRGGAVTVENAADRAVALPKHDMGKIHRRLPRESGRGRAPRRCAQLLERNSKRRGNRVFQKAAKLRGFILAPTRRASGALTRPGFVDGFQERHGDTFVGLFAYIIACFLQAGISIFSFIQPIDINDVFDSDRQTRSHYAQLWQFHPKRCLRPRQSEGARG